MRAVSRQKDGLTVSWLGGAKTVRRLVERKFLRTEMSGEKPVARIPVSFVTGFLGSGKTTMIAALLRQPDLAGTAVVVNEFGAVGLDDAIFAETTDPGNIKLLANGCMCCVADDDLVVTLLELTRRTALPPARIIVETTGLADPVNLLHKIMIDPRLRPFVRLDAVLATVDAVNGLQNINDEEVARRQAAVADRRLITKTDLVDVGTVAKLAERLQALNGGAEVLSVSHGQVSADRLFGMSLVDAKTGEADLNRWLNLEGHRANGEPGGENVHFSGGHKHGEGMGTWLIEESRPLDLEHLKPRIGAIVERHGNTLLRLKGVVRTSGDERPLVVHGVQRIFHTPIWLKKWPDTPRTALVAIASDGAQAIIDALTQAITESVVDTSTSGVVRRK